MKTPKRCPTGSGLRSCELVGQLPEPILQLLRGFLPDEAETADVALATGPGFEHLGP